MRIASAASAFPKHYYSQKFILERLKDYWGDQLKNSPLLARLHHSVTVDGRYLAMPAEQYLEMKTWGQANDIWIKVAQELGERALCLALPHHLASCTGASFLSRQVPEGRIGGLESKGVSGRSI